MKKLLSLLLAVCLCLGLSAAVFASNTRGITYQAVTDAEDATLYKSDAEQTVVVRVDADQDFTYTGIGGRVVIPEGFELVGVSHDSVNFATNKDKFSYFDQTIQDNQTSNVCILTYKIDANVTGTFRLGIENLEITAGAADTWEKGGSVYTTLTIETPAQSISLDRDKLTLVAGEQEKLKATLTPADATNTKINWVSSNEKVATVDEDGVVTAKAPGKATITASADADPALTDTCEVTVTEEPIAITGISLDDAEVSVGRTIQLKPEFTPADTTQRGVTWESSDETIATVDKNGRVKGLAEGKVTITVTSTEDDSIFASCIVTVTPKDNDYAGIIAGGTVISGIGSDNLPFNDVSFRNYYYNAVKWAVDKGITTGTGRYTFSPDAACTRAQVVTFLWRAAGSPAPMLNENPFTDVHTSDYYYDAVLWAVQNGITNGTSAKTFSPDATVTRAQVVTFLWRANGQSAAGNSGFADVSSNAYYAKAVDWAFANGITTGMDYGAFGPDTACTRAQIVTFLYRAR